MERFIPVSRSELIEDLCSFPHLSHEFKKLFRLFCKQYSAVYHAQLHQKLTLIDNYLPFSPDRDSLSLINYSQEQYSEFQNKLLKNIDNILGKANFEHLSQQQLNAALNKTSPYGVEVSVNFDVFDEIQIYFRGSAVHTEYKRLWSSLFLKKTKIEVNIYRRLFILLKPKSIKTRIKELQNSSNLSYQQAEKKIHKKLQMLEDVLNQQTIFIKLFKDIPQSDLEMLFPNTRIRMSLFDKIKLSITGGGGTIAGIVATMGKIAATIDPITIIISLAGFAGVLWRQIKSIFNQRTKYLATLSRHLYYYNLDNNRGALAHIIDLAEVEECKEAILAYFFLLQQEYTRKDSLDQKIEGYMLEKYSVKIDFEVSDSIKKLKEMDLLIDAAADKNMIKVIPLESSQTVLKKHWNQLI